MSYRIVTDTCCDFPMEMYEQLNLTVVPLTLTFRGTEHNSFSEAFLKDLYNGMRQGESGSTSAVNPDGWANAMEPVLAAGELNLVCTFLKRKGRVCREDRFSAVYTVILTS